MRYTWHNYYLLYRFQFVELVRISVKVEVAASTFLTMWRIILMDCTILSSQEP